MADNLGKYTPLPLKNKLYRKPPPAPTLPKINKQEKPAAHPTTPKFEKRPFFKKRT